MAMKPDDLFLCPSLAQEQMGVVAGDVTSTVRLGYRYLSGSAGVVNLQQAQIYFRQMDPASPIATAWCGWINIRSKSATVNQAGLQKLQTVSQSGDPVGQTLMGRAYELGVGGLRANVSLAKQLYTAASGQFALAKTYLARITLQAGDVKGAVTLMTAAAAAGEILSMSDLAALYRKKSNHFNFTPRAKQTLKTAVGRNDPEAMYRLGSLYMTPSGGAPTTNHMGFYQVHQSAKLGYPPAYTATAMAYANGTGVKQNFSAAAYWFKKAVNGA
jgi:TPR repeat protein